MAIQKRPYELSIWIEKLNGNNSKIEEKGVIIGAHDMSYPGKATNIILKREIKGTNTLTFQMPDRYFDSLKGDYVHNEFIDLIFPEAKLKLFYKDRWFEFFVKKVDDKKQFKSYMKSFTCSDAFIDELSRNGYGITYDTELYNNVEEIGTFMEETLEDSIWQYYPEHNWGDFTEYKEEKLYRIPIGCFGGKISGYKLKFELENEQRNEIKERIGTDCIKNLYTKDIRPIELSDDLASGYFWDEYVENGTIRNELKKEYYDDIDNDGFIYVPYSCLSFCYGQKEKPKYNDNDFILEYDRAATETAIDIDGQLIISPPSVDPRTIIQFYAIPKTGVLELDDAGVIMNKDYTFFLPLAEWNRMIKMDKDWWYIFEDTQLVHGEILSSADVQQPYISHTFKYLIDGENKILNTDYESRGNKCVIYDGYLSNINDNSIVKGKKFSITNRTEINISEDIDQYTTIYNAHADDFISEYTNENWDYRGESRTAEGNQYRVCSKLETRQVIPQLARNLVQNGIKMDTIDGWAPMSYLTEDGILKTPAVVQRGIIRNETDETISSSCLVFQPTVAQVAYIWEINHNDGENAPINETTFLINGKSYKAGDLNDSKRMSGFVNSYLANIQNTEIYLIGTRLYTKQIIEGRNLYTYFCDKNDNFYKGLIRPIGTDRKSPFTITQTKNIEKIDPIDSEIIYYVDENSYWDSDVTIVDSNTMWGREMYEISNYTRKEATITTGTQMINFGIIGQQKIIEKDKIYCLGVQAIIRNKEDKENFKVKIGKGSLISEGNYTIADNYLEFDWYDILDENYSFDWAGSGVDSEKNNIIIAEEPKTKFVLFKSNYTIENPYFVIEASNEVILLKLYLFEAYTKGIDCFSKNESLYRYSGRDLFWPPKGKNEIVCEKLVKTEPYLYPTDSSIKEDNIHNQIIFEDDIMLGTSYSYQHYYIQRLKATLTNKQQGKIVINCDTMGHEEYLSSDIKKIKESSLPLDAAKCTSDDYEIQTNYIDLTKCYYYNKEADIDECDCSYGNGQHTCYYQKFGYCPFRFKTEKHNRRIRTLSINKSNRFNIIQSISKVFEVYPQFYIEHKTNGSVIKNDDGEYLKKVFFITEKGKENKIGFRYEKNLKDISRNIVSDKIVSKLYVLDVDSEISKTGLCSIKTAEDNISKDSYLIDLSYYVAKGMLDADEIEQDLYGIIPTSDIINGNEIPSGFLRQLGYYNTQYDDISNKIINLQDASFTELEANLTVNYQGIITAQEQILKIKKQLDKYKEIYNLSGGGEQQQTYLNYLNKLSEQQSILAKLIDITFFTDGVCDAAEATWQGDCFNSDNIYDTMTPMEFFSHINNLEDSKKYWIDQHKYTKGILGQFNSEYLQIQQWKRERASYLKLINQISSSFYKKYEPYLKEGTWSDDNYLTDNAYYFGALDVAADGAIPKVSYSINVIDIVPLSEEYDEIYDFDLADITYVEDIGMFGINKHTGLPNRLKTLVSAIEEGLDNPDKDKIDVQNFTTSFQDLFQQITSSVQSLTYNENIYKRSSNFTSLQNITNSSLQGALDTNELTLINTEENNIQVDNTGTSGSDINNHANKYKLDGQGLFFSNDGGQHWSVGVGPSGINADYIKVGQLDAGKIRIADSSYVYFSWDKEGIAAYRDPQAITTDSKNINDAAIFNKHGLSIINDGNIKLRAGYKYTGERGGNISSEAEIGDEIGFYLYNSNGNIIFSTATSQSQDKDTAAKETASLFLVGEMLITNNSEIMTSHSHFTDGVVKDEAQYFNASIEDFINEVGTIEIQGQHATVFNWIAENDEDYLNICSYVLNTDPAVSEIEIGEKIYSISNLTSDVACIYLKINNQFIQAWKRTFTYEINGTIGDKIFYKIDSSLNISIISIKNYQSSLGNLLYILTTNAAQSIDSNNWTSQTCTPSFFSDGTTMEDQTYHYNYKLGESRVIYKVDDIENVYYLTKSQSAGGSGLTNGEVALYLNNKTDLTADVKPIEGKASRLFTCCSSKSDGTINNLFSILKDGQLHIGGIIDDEQDATNLNDQISISGSGIYIDASDGTLKMDFNRINGSDGTPLTTYIADMISQESSALQTLTAGLINSAVSDLASANHVHYIGTTGLECPDITDKLSPNAQEIWLDPGQLPEQDVVLLFGYRNTSTPPLYMKWQDFLQIICNYIQTKSHYTSSPQ